MKKNMKGLILGLSLVSAPCGFSALAQCTGNWETSPDYYIAWQDEFNYSSTSDPTFLSKWTILNRDDNWGTEYFRPEQVSMNNGALRLTAFQQTKQDANGNWNKHYKSGAVVSKIDIDPNLGNEDGFYYGILEFNARIPSGNIDVNDLWPALWTYSELGTEIDIVDGSTNGKSIVSNLIDWRYAPRPWSPYWTQVHYTPSSYTTFNHNVVYNHGDYVENAGLFYQNLTGGDIEAKSHGITVNQEVWNTGETFASGFNRFAVSWEPDKVTFYINGREIMTVDDVETRKKTCNIIMSLQSGWGGTPSGGVGTMIPTDYMEIDYVRLYRPVNHDHTVSPYPSYKSDNEYMFTNISEYYSSFSKVNAAPNSIIADKNNPNIVYYRGKDNKLYTAQKWGNGTWSIAELAPGYSWPEWTKVGGDIIFSEGKIIYRGSEGRLQCFGKSGGSWAHWTIDDDWLSGDHYVSSEPGAISVTAQGKIVYRGTDDQMHMFQWDAANSDWVGSRLPHTYSTGELINGDVLAGSGSEQVYYRGENGKIQNFWLYNGNYVHGNIGSVGVKNNPSSMTLTSSGIYFIGTDNKLHKYYWNSGWQHELLESTSGSSIYSVSTWNFGYIKTSYAYSTVRADISDPTNNTVLYFGEDGRLQQMKKVGGNWTHRWIDDYSNTDFHASYPNQTSGTGYASAAVTSDGKIIYNQYNKNLSSFEFGNCENLNPASHDGILKSTLNTHEVQQVVEERTVSLFPNPALGKVNLEVEGERMIDAKIMDLSGKVVSTIVIDSSEKVEVNISDLTSGLYTVVVHLEDGSVLNSKLTIQ